MNLSERAISGINVVGGRLCLDFTNTVGKRERAGKGKIRNAEAYIIRDEKLCDYFDLLAWGLRVGILMEAEAGKLAREVERSEARAKSVWKRAINLREAIYRICIAIVNKKKPLDSDLELLNQELAIAHDRLKLSADRENALTWKWVEKGSPDQLLCFVVDSAAELLTRGDLSRLGQCERCGWLFEDTSRNRSRQWCDMKDCGNLVKVHRFRSRAHKAK